MDFTSLHSKQTKMIFSSPISMEYQNPKLEVNYKNMSRDTEKKKIEVFCQFLFFLGISICALEGFLFFFDKPENHNLKMNFVFSCLILAINVCLLIILALIDKTNIQGPLKNLCHFFIHFCLDNFFLSLISILLVSYQFGIEMIAAILIIKLSIKSFLAMFIHRSFLKSLCIIIICLVFKFVFLLSIHVIKAVIYYCLMLVVFNAIILCFVYMYEYMTKIYFYSFFKLAREKEYFLETMNFFNVFYFASRNKNVTKSIKLETLLRKIDGTSDERKQSADINNAQEKVDGTMMEIENKFNKFNYKENSQENSQENSNENSSNQNILSLSKIEHIMGKLISFDNMNFPAVERYFMESIRDGNFKFKTLVKIIKNYQNLSSNTSRSTLNFTDNTSNNSFFPENTFKKFTSIGILKIEDAYLQLFLKIKFCNDKNSKKFQQDENESKTSNEDIDNCDLENVKVEGLFLDVTQSHLKKETQTNSLILAKYIHDLKSPLILLEKLVKNYKNKINKILETKNFSNTTSRINIKIAEYSKNIQIISKSIFEMIHSINNFTKKQNKLISTNENKKDKKLVNFRKMVNECVDFYKIYIHYIDRGVRSYQNLKKSKENIKFSPPKIKIYAEIDDKIPQFIYSDEFSLKQIFMNLISNAIKFTYHGEVKVMCKLITKFELHEEKKYISINVMDTGMGIEETLIHKLCQPFSISSPNVCQGSGLGLSIVADLLASINSKLLIYSKKNKGSNFSFELPIEVKSNNEVELIEESEINDEDENLDSNEIEAEGEKEQEQELYIPNIDSSIQFIEAAEKDAEEILEDDKKTCYFEGPMFEEKISLLYSLLEKNKKEKLTEGFKYFQTERSHKSDSRDNKSKFMSEKSKEFTGKNMCVKKRYFSTQNVTKYKNKIKIINIGSDYAIPSRKESFNSRNNIKINLCDNNLNILSEKPPMEIGKKIIVPNPNIPEMFYPPEKSLNILILDDDPFYISQVKYQINSISKNLGVNSFVETGNNPIEGLYSIYHLLKNKNVLFDLVITDEYMPFMKGSIFVKFYKESLSQSGFYKLFFTSSSGDNFGPTDDLKAKFSAVFDYKIDKPSKRSEVQTLLENVLKFKKKYYQNENREIDD